MSLIRELSDQIMSKAFYEARYSSGYMEDWDDEKKKRIVEIIGEMNLPETGSALDFGCGNGVLTDVIRLALPKWRVVGADFSETAIANARLRVSGCSFCHTDELAVSGRRFDFIFTHHLWEHVFDFNVVWGQLISCAAESCRMLHILPCGNPGSLEYEICRLRTDGISWERGNRFFFEEEAHLRRLSGEELSEKARRSSFTLTGEYYANHYYGAILWITDSEFSFIRSLYDPKACRTIWSGIRLWCIRNKLFAIAVFRRIAGVLTRPVPRNSRHLLKVALVAPMAPLAWVIHRYYAAKGAAEWENRKSDRRGSEMYLIFGSCGPRSLDGRDGQKHVPVRMP